jgi:hypothetical protein
MLRTEQADTLLSHLGTRRCVVALLGVVVYAALTGIAIARSWHHYELFGIFLRYAVLLPAVVYGLRTPAAAEPFSMPRRRGVLLVLGFLLIAAVVSWRVNDGILADESSYQFQARTIATGEISAPLPAGALERPAETPQPLRFNHQIFFRGGWFSKYPIGWPAVLAFPERVNAGWLVSPLLGALLLVLVGLAAREAYGPAVVFPAVAMAALSPYFLANSVGRMSHTLAATLVAAATVLCIQGLKAGKLSRFGWMFLPLVATFHVRPLTALVASLVLGVGALIGTRAQRALCARVAALGGVAAVLALSSFLLYNWRFTGHPLLSPYALYRGTNIPLEVSVTVPQLARNLSLMWRFASQGTILYSFPFLAVLVIYALWVSKPKSSVPWILLALPCALVCAHLVQFEGSGAPIGERYWFEGYFAIVVLAAEGLRCLLVAWRPDHRTVVALVIGLAATQLGMMAEASTKLDEHNLPFREIARAARTYGNCDCVVYVMDTPPQFYGAHLNLNGPDWPSARVFYALDPGPGERARWTGILHRRRWVVLRYDSRSRVANPSATGSL